MESGIKHGNFQPLLFPESRLHLFYHCVFTSEDGDTCPLAEWTRALFLESRSGWTSSTCSILCSLFTLRKARSPLESELILEWTDYTWSIRPSFVWKKNLKRVMKLSLVSVSDWLVASVNFDPVFSTSWVISGFFGFCVDVGLVTWYIWAKKIPGFTYNVDKLGFGCPVDIDG